MSRKAPSSALTDTWLPYVLGWRIHEHTWSWCNTRGLCHFVQKMASSTSPAVILNHPVPVGRSHDSSIKKKRTRCRWENHQWNRLSETKRSSIGSSEPGATPEKIAGMTKATPPVGLNVNVSVTNARWDVSTSWNMTEKWSPTLRPLEQHWRDPQSLRRLDQPTSFQYKQLEESGLRWIHTSRSWRQHQIDVGDLSGSLLCQRLLFANWSTKWSQCSPSSMPSTCPIFRWDSRCVQSPNVSGPLCSCNTNLCPNPNGITERSISTSKLHGLSERDDNNSRKTCVTCRKRSRYHSAAHTNNDTTNFQGITDRLAAPTFVDHDLPLNSGESIKEVTVKRRTQNLHQLPDHTRFAGRLVLVDQSSPSLESFSFVGQENFQRFPFAEENQCMIEVYCNTFQLGTLPILESNILSSQCSLISRSCHQWSDDFLHTSALKSSWPSTKHPRPVGPTGVLAIEVFWLVSRRKRSKSESSIVSSKCLLRPGRTTATSLRRISLTRFRPIHVLLQHLPSCPEGFQQLSHLLRRFLVLSQSIGHLHHLLKQHCSLLFHHSDLTTQTKTYQDSTSRSFEHVSSVLPNSHGHDGFSWPFHWRLTSWVHSAHAPPCSISQEATKLTLPCKGL